MSHLPPATPSPPPCSAAPRSCAREAGPRGCSAVRSMMWYSVGAAVEAGVGSSVVGRVCAAPSYLRARSLHALLLALPTSHPCVP